MAEIPAAVRALSFGGIAEHYDRYRPAPPRAATEWVLPVRATDVVELGAGTGGLTRVLLDQIDGRVVAAEPDARMRAVLARCSLGALVVGAFAEALPVAGGCLDAVLVSSAWHWMQPEATVAEVARVLRPGGRLGVIGNGPDRRLGWVAELFGEDWRRAGAHVGARSDPDPGPPFGPVEHRRVEWTLRMTSDEIVGLAGTYSSLFTRPAPEREERLGRLRAHAEALVGSASVDVPMVCRCWRATRT